MNFTPLDTATSHKYHIAGYFFSGIAVAKKYYGTALEQILEEFILKNLSQMFAV